MNDYNIKKYVVPLIDADWNKKDKRIIDRVKLTFEDSLYFRCLKKIYPSYMEYILICLITSFKYKKYKPYDILLNYNEEIKKMYFIIQGKLNIYRISSSKIKLLISTLLKQNKNIDNCKEILDYFNNYIKRYVRVINHKNINIYDKNQINIIKDSEISKIIPIDDLENFFKAVINNNKAYNYSLEEGKVFGEEYLYNCINFSNFILESDSDSIIAELSKEDYLKIYKRLNIIERSNITNFLVNLKIFNTANLFLPKLQRCFIKRNFEKNEIIFKQNEPFRAFYIIRKGKVNLSLKISKKVICNLDPELIMGNQDTQRISEREEFLVKGNYLEKNEFNLITVQEGEFIGDIEYYNNEDKYLYTAKCVEGDCILFEIDIFLFENLIKNNITINKNLKGFFEKIKEKINYYQDRIYIMKRNSNLLKKSDYLLSKNLFTRNILKNHYINEDKSNISENYLLNSMKKKMNKSDYFYYGVISPFINKRSSSQRNKRFNKIHINDVFFTSLSHSKEEGILGFNTSRSNQKSTERNITYPKFRKKSNSRLILYNNLSNKICPKLILPKENIYKTNNKNNNSNNNSYKNLIRNKKNNVLRNSLNNLNYNLNIFPVKKSKLFINQENDTSNKKDKLFKDNFNLNTDKSFDFMEPNLVFSGNEKNKNIPFILKETKKLKKYKEVYDKKNIQKLKLFYFSSPKNKNEIKIYKNKK